MSAKRQRRKKVSSGVRKSQASRGKQVKRSVTEATNVRFDCMLKVIDKENMKNDRRCTHEQLAKWKSKHKGNKAKS